VPAAALFWSPLLDGNARETTLARYRTEVQALCAFIRDQDGARIESSEEFDYWVAYYAHFAYTSGSPAKGAVQKALAGVEFWLPEVKPLSLARRCVRGWDRLVPPRPAAPLPLDLVVASTALLCLTGALAEGTALLLAFDCWLRIGEVAGLLTDDIVDNRMATDAAVRGVSVFLPLAKTGRRQAVRLADPAVASLVLAWREVVVTTRGHGALLFPGPDVLRAGLARALGTFQLDARGLHFVFHSLRHGGASRAYAAGQPMSDILLRGRWAAESSGRHYVQAGRQMLLAIALPPDVSALSRRLLREGLLALYAPNLRELLHQ